MPHGFDSNDGCRFKTTVPMVRLALLIVILATQLAFKVDSTP